MKQQNQFQAQQSENLYMIFGPFVNISASYEVMLTAAMNSKILAEPSFVLSNLERQSKETIVSICWEGIASETIMVYSNHLHSCTGKQRTLFWT